MTQNIYDNETFFMAYKALRQNDTGLNGALEVPALQALLPVLTGLHILDVGCGFGDFARFARQQGASSVIGVDVSTRMLTEAHRLTADPQISYQCMPLEDYIPAECAFDLVVSSMALHYIDDYATALAHIYAALKPGGSLVFSVEHPLCTAYPMGGFCVSATQEKHWPVSRYSDESARATHWFVGGVIKYHRTLASYVNLLLDTGFTLSHLGEPQPTPASLRQQPELRDHLLRPPVLLLAAQKQG